MTRRWMPLAWLAALALALFAVGRGFHPAWRTPPPEPPGDAAVPAPVADLVSCKPSVPLQIDLLPAGRPDHWTLRLRSLDMDRDVVLRMGSGADADAQILWQGRLTADRDETLEVRFAATGNAAAVWAALEVANLPRGAMRVVAEAPRAAAAAELAAPPRQLLRNPETGEEVIQFTGQVVEK